MNNAVLAPAFDGSEKERMDLFGSKDATRDLPIRSHPFSQRRQENQGYTNMCTIYATAEIFENKVFWETGRWYEFPKTEIYRIWEKMKAMGIAGDKWGAYVNSPVKALQGEVVTMQDRVTGETLRVTLVEWFKVATKADSVDVFAEKVLREIVFGGGVVTGINSRMSKLDYYAAAKSPYIVRDQESTQKLAHAITMSSFDMEVKPDLVASSGSWGDNFADSGVVWFKTEHLRRLFTPIGFTVNIEE